MWIIKHKVTGEVFRVFAARGEFDLQPAQLVTAECIFRGAGSTTHYAEEVSDPPEMLAAKAKADRRAEIFEALEEIDRKSIRSLRDGDTEVLSQYAERARDLRLELRSL